MHFDFEACPFYVMGGNVDECCGSSESGQSKFGGGDQSWSGLTLFDLALEVLVHAGELLVDPRGEGGEEALLGVFYPKNEHTMWPPQSSELSTDQVTHELVPEQGPAQADRSLFRDFQTMFVETQPVDEKGELFLGHIPRQHLDGRVGAGEEGQVDQRVVVKGDLGAQCVGLEAVEDAVNGIVVQLVARVVLHRFQHRDDKGEDRRRDPIPDKSVVDRRIVLQRVVENAVATDRDAQLLMGFQLREDLRDDVEREPLEGRPSGIHLGTLKWR